MNKYSIKIALFLLIGISLLVASCTEILVVDKPDRWTFSVENLLDENVILSGTINENQFSLTLSPKESYTYTQDTMSGFIENGKTPIFSATSIKLVGATAGTVEYQTEAVFHKTWIEKTEHHLVFNITSSLFQTE